MMLQRWIVWFLALAGATAWVGCGSKPSTPAGVESGTTSSSSAAAPAGTSLAANASAPEQPAVKKSVFVPPAWEAIKDVKWLDNPLIDGLELARKLQAEQHPPLSAAEALKLKNDSDQNNQLIVASLGRLPASDAEVNWDATFTRHLRGDVKSTNPIMFNSVEEGDIAQLIALDLFSFDAKFNRYGAREALVSWQTSEDRLMDKIVLRDDLVWSDGQPITAHDIEFTYDVIMDDRVPVPSVRNGVDKLAGIKAYDDRTLVYFHPEASPVNDSNINFPVLPKHIYEETRKEDPTLVTSPKHNEYEKRPISGGPYTVVSRTLGQEIVLERRENYYLHNGKQVRDKPYFKQVVFRVIPDPTTALLSLEKGDLDDLILTPEDWTTKTGGNDFYARNTKVRAPEWTYFYFCWNLKTPYFSDVRVRKAMSYAFDYQEMLDKLCYGLYQQSRGIFHADAWMAPQPMPEPYRQDLDRAESLLDEAGWTDSDGDGIRDKMVDGRRVPFKFTMLCGEPPLAKAICALLKESLEQIGVVCNVKPLERTTLQALVMEHDFEAEMAGWGTGTDPYTLENIFGTGEGRNHGWYSNPEVDRLFKEGLREFDRTKRAAIYAKIHLLIWEDQPYTFLYSRSAFYAFNKELRGYTFSPRGPYHFTPGFTSFWRVPAAQ